MKHNPKTAILVILALVTSSLLGIAVVVGAQDQRQPSPAVVPPSEVQPAWTANQLDNLVAPIALYPDPLLSQMLVASTYPLEIVEAGQWLQRNKNLRGQTLIDAAKQQPWDPSIQTLVAVPDALDKLDQDIQWTTDLGNAFLAQEDDVMNAVQRMRVRAEADGRLATTTQQKVIDRYDEGQRVIVIEPAYPDVVYVPVYDPFYVWGPPVYGFYPPLYYPSFGFGFGIGYNLGFCFADWGGWGFWGWGPSWYRHSVIVNNYFFNHYGFRHHWGGGERDRMVWVHNPVHRLNVPYRNPQVAARFSGRSMASRDSFRTAPERNSAGARFGNRPDNRLAEGRHADQGNRNAPLPAQRSQNSPRERYQSAPRNQTPSNQSRMTPQVERSQNRAEQRSQVQQPYRSNPQRYDSGQQRTSEGPRVVPFGSQRQQQQDRAPQQYRSSPQTYRAPQVQRYQSAPQQTYRAPQVQQSRSMPQQRIQASPQFRSAPQMSAPRSSGGGGFSRSSGGGGGSSRGGGGGASRSGGRGR